MHYTVTYRASAINIYPFWVMHDCCPILTVHWCLQAQSTRLVTPHSLRRTKTDTWKLSNILLKNISVTQNVCVATNFDNCFSVHDLLVVCTVTVNKAGDTPLSLECSRGNLEMVKALTNKHVDLNSKYCIDAWWYSAESVNIGGTGGTSLSL